MRISVDGSRIRNNKVAFSNLSGIVWTGSQSVTLKNQCIENGVRFTKLELSICS